MRVDIKTKLQNWQSFRTYISEEYVLQDMKKDAIWEWNITIWVMTYLLPLRKNTKLVVATVGGGFQVGEPPAIMLFVTE